MHFLAGFPRENLEKEHMKLECMHANKIPSQEKKVVHIAYLNGLLKFIYSEKATKFCEISIVDLTVTT